MIAYNTVTEYLEVISNGASTWLADSVMIHGTLYTPALIINEHPLHDVPYSEHQSYQDTDFPAIMIMENDRPRNDRHWLYRATPSYYTSNDLISTFNINQLKNVSKAAPAILAERTIDNTASNIFARTKIPIVQTPQTFPNPLNRNLKSTFCLSQPGFVESKIILRSRKSFS